MTRFQKILLSLVILSALFLRLYKISGVPPGLSADEAAIGYNAYSILKTGKDEYGERFPIYFKSFGDYKLPGYIYTTSLSILIFGKNEFAVRFPSTLAGTLTILILFFLVKDLVLFNKKNDKIAIKIAFFSTFLLAISPWHLQFSRAGFEANLALFFYIFAVWLTVLHAKSKKTLHLVSAVVLFVFSVYTYHSYRLLAPLTLVGTWVILFPKRKSLPELGKHILIFFILTLPVFFNIERLSQTFTFDEYKTPTLISKLYTYPLVFLRNYLSHFSFEFLYIKGDGFGRHQLPDFGLLYKWTLPFLLIGFYNFIKDKRNAFKHIVLFLLFAAPLASSFARPTPHTLRSLPFIIPLTIVIAYGISEIFHLVKKGRFVFLSFFLIFSLYEFLLYGHLYLSHYPKVNQLDWGGGYKEVVLRAKKYHYDYIVIDKNHLDFAPIYFKFYDDSLTPIYVNSRWRKPTNWQNRRVLFIHPDYGNKNEKNLEVIYIPNNPHKDIFVQFWKS